MAASETSSDVDGGGGDVLWNQPIVIDVGSSYIRFGKPNTAPQLSIPTLVGYPRTRAHAGMDAKTVFVGTEAATRRAICSVSSPVVHGQIQSWNDLEVIFKHAYQLLGAAVDNHPVMITESLSAKHSDRLDLGKMLFEMHVPAVSVVPQGVTGLFSTGRTSGVVLDSGEGRSHSVAVVNGIALPASKVASSVCGGLVTDNLSRLISRHGISSSRDHMAEAKEELCYCALDFDTEMRLAEGNSASFRKDHALPDGQFISVDKERFEAAELNFSLPRRGDFQGKQMVDLPTAVVLSATSAEESLRELMLRNVVAVGGNSMLSGFHERLELELNRRAALKEYWNKSPMKVPHVPHHIAASDCNWIGASMIAGLSASRQLYITDADVKEEGMAAITKHRLAEFAR